MPPSLSILHVLAPAQVGGLQRVVHALAIGHHRQGHTVHVVPVVEPGQASHPFIRSLMDAGVHVCTLEIPVRAYLRERRSVRALCERLRPDILHTHGYRPDVLHVGVAHSCGIPAVTTEHGASMLGGRTRISEWLQLRSLRRFEAVAAVSTKIAERLGQRWIPAERVHVIPNAWDGARPRLNRDRAREALGLPQEADVVGWVGRLIYAKGCDVFLRAMAETSKTRLISIIGDGPERSALIQLASDLGLRDRILFHGTMEAAGDLFRAFDLFVLSSRTEGTPIVLFEAMAARIPIVATKVGGVPNVVRPNLEAISVPPEHPRALAQAIDEALSNQQKSQQRVEAAEHRLTTVYDTGAWLDRYVELYRNVVADAAG